jgi:hypothetical protein
MSRERRSISDKEVGKAFLKLEFFKIPKTSEKRTGDFYSVSKMEDMVNLGELWGYYCGYTS